MERILPGSFVELLAGMLLLSALIVVVVSLCLPQNKPAMRLSSMVLFVASLCLFSNNGWVYFIGVIIIAFTITDMEVIRNIAVLLRHPHQPAVKQSLPHNPAPKTVVQTSPDSGNRTIVSKPPVKKTVKKLPVLEKEILHTIWTQQQNKWPDMSTLYTLRIDPAESDYHEMVEAGKCLVAEQLVGLTSNGDYYLTQLGYEYCKTYGYTFSVH